MSDGAPAGGHAPPAPRPISYQGTGGVALAGDVRGPEDGPVALLLHGGGQTRHSWGGTADAIAARGIRAVSIDARGHGESSWAPDGDYRATTQARDVASVIEQMGTLPVIIGASMGGITSLLLEGEVAPGSTRGIVLVDVVPEVEEVGANRIRGFMADRAETGFATLEEVADAIAAYNPHRPRPKDLSGLSKNLRQRDGRWYWHWDPRFLDGVSRRDSNGFDLTDQLLAATARISVPMMLVRGLASDLVSEAKAERFLARFPSVRYVSVPGAGHMVAGDRNDAFTDAVLEFLASHA